MIGPLAKEALWSQRAVRCLACHSSPALSGRPSSILRTRVNAYDHDLHMHTPIHHAVCVESTSAMPSYHRAHAAQAALCIPRAPVLAAACGMRNVAHTRRCLHIAAAAARNESAGVCGVLTVHASLSCALLTCLVPACNHSRTYDMMHAPSTDQYCGAHLCRCCCHRSGHPAVSCARQGCTTPGTRRLPAAS